MHNDIIGVRKTEEEPSSIRSSFYDLAILWSQVGGENRKARAAILCVMMLLNMVLEIVGVGIIFSVISLMMDGQDGSLLQLQWIKLDDLLGTDPSHHVTIALVLLVVLFTLKAVLQGLVAASVASFSYKLQADLARMLYANYLNQPYEFHLVRNSEKLINTINNEARDAASSINNILSSIAELCVAIGLGVFLISISPLTGIAIALIAASVGAIIIRQNRTRLERWGHLMRQHQAMKMQSLRQGFDGYKEIRLRGFMGRAVDAFDKHNVAYTDAGSHFVSLGAVPRLWMEWVAIVGFALAVFMLNTLSQSYQSMLPYLGTIAAGAFRLLPSLSRIVNGMQNLRYFAPTVSNVVEEIRAKPSALPTASEVDIKFANDIAFEKLSYVYPDTNRPVLNEFSARILPGTLVGIVGPSGAGKSTFIDLLLGFIQPTKGHVTVDGLVINTGTANWQQRIGYVPQSIFVMDDTLRRNIAFGVPDEVIDDQRITEVLRAVHMESLLSDNLEGLQLHLGDRGLRLSGGQRQRIAIARALYQRPEILVVDEGTSGLDSATETSILKTIRSLRGTMTIIVASHNPNALVEFDQIIMIRSHVSC
jgi:ATP-binding cassette, subfamily B, bacterial PglK